MGVPVALVLVSHSRSLAEGLAELAGQMAPDVVLVPAGGTDDGRLGTGFDTIQRAMERAVEDGRSAVVLTDLGSAVLTTESVLEVLDDDVVARVRVADAPFVEGAVAAAVAAQGGAGPDEVLAAARHAVRSFGPGADAGPAGEGRGDGADPAAALDAAAAPAGGADLDDRAGLVDGATAGAGHGRPVAPGGQAAPESPAPSGAGHGGATTGLVAGSSRGAVAVFPDGSEDVASDDVAPQDAGSGGTASPVGAGTGAGRGAGRAEVSARGTAVLRNRLGLHARPAAQLARTAGAFESSIEVNGVDLRSVLSVIALGAVGGTELVVTATGPDAPTAVRAVVAEIEEGFGEA